MGEAKKHKFIVLNITQPTVDLKCFCGVEFNTNMYDLLYGKVRSCGCVKSLCQSEIAGFIQALGFETLTNVRDILPNRLELDIYIPKVKLAVEYCGIYWHGELKNPNKNRHLEKLQECEKLGIRLITIFSDEFLQKQEIVFSYLKSVLNQNKNKVGARKLWVRAISSAEAQTFWRQNHIQGASRTPISYGLFNGQELVSAVGFRSIGNNTYELVRYANKPDWQISGGFNKLLSRFEKMYNPQKIVSFSDLRWSIGGVYQRNGFKKEARLPPSYSYFKSNTENKRFHKSNFRKKKISCHSADPNATEWDIMKSIGYDRIWDCGIERWVK